MAAATALSTTTAVMMMTSAYPSSRRLSAGGSFSSVGMHCRSCGSGVLAGVVGMAPVVCVLSGKVAAALGEEPTQRGDEVRIRAQVTHIDTQLGEDELPLAAVAEHGLAVGVAHGAVRHVDVVELTGFGVLHAHTPRRCRQLQLHGVAHAQGNELMPEVQLADGLLVRRHHKVADEEAHGALALRAQDFRCHLFHAHLTFATLRRDNLANDAQALLHSLRRGQVKVRVAPVEQQPHVVSVAGSTVGQHGSYARGVLQLAVLRITAGVAHAGTGIHRQQQHLLTLLVELAHVWRAGARRHLPVDESGLIPGLVLAEIIKLQALPTETRPVLAGQSARGEPPRLYLNTAHLLHDFLRPIHGGEFALLRGLRHRHLGEDAVDDVVAGHIGCLCLVREQNTVAQNVMCQVLHILRGHVRALAGECQCA